MRRLLAVVLLLVLTACGDPHDVPPRPVGFTEATCPDLLIVGVRGQNQSPDANEGLGTEVRLVSTALTKALQSRGDVTVRRESVDYTSDPPADLDSYGRAVTAAATTLDDRLDALEKSCDGTRIAVLGFSMGANVVHAALHDRPAGSIRVVAMIADPQRDPAATYDVDAFGQAAPHAGSLGAGPGFGDLADRAVAFCASGDDVCNHAPGESRTDTNQVHQHFYEDPDHVDAMVREMTEVLARSGF